MRAAIDAGSEEARASKRGPRSGAVVTTERTATDKGLQFAYFALNLPMSLIVRGQQWPRGYEPTFMSMPMKGVNGVFAGIVILALIPLARRIQHRFFFRAVQLAEIKKTNSVERIVDNLTDEKLGNLLFFPYSAMRRSIVGDVLFVFIVLTVLSVGMQVIVAIPQALSGISGGDSGVPSIFLWLIWIVRMPLSLIFSQKVFSSSPALIFLNSLICALAIGAFRWWLSSAKKPHG